MGIGFATTQRKGCAMKRTSALRQLLRRDDIAVLMEAHNGLTAKLVEEAGFKAVWASGLAISASLGVRDSNEASWTQTVEIAEFMADATELPILFDGDTGHGNFNNARRLVRKLEQRGIAGICIEDKIFPKANSFVTSKAHGLEGIDEFCGKIRAAKDHQLDPDFVVVARTEAFIEAQGLQEALDRASAYAEAGADAVLVHSKRADAEEVTAFAQQWSGTIPIVVVPTTYSSVPLASLAAAGINNFIFANHSIRTVVSAVQQILRELSRTSRLAAVENRMAPLEELFRLQDVPELQEAERRYFAPALSGEIRSAPLRVNGAS